MEKILNELKSFLKTLLFFIIACLLLPVILLSFICNKYSMEECFAASCLSDDYEEFFVNNVHYADALVNYILTIKYPLLTISKSKKIRTLIDTPRNAGIFHFLVQIQGSCDYEKIKRFYTDHLTDARDKLGFLRFPKLRQKLAACWGHYAWVNDTSSFNINNHVILAPRTFRGRSVSEANIEDFVSDLVTKYIPSDLPQWQVILIPIASKHSVNQNEPSFEDEHYYLLIKIHHLIIAEEEDLHISEMLMLQENGRRQTIDFNELTELPKTQNLSYFVRKPVHIENLVKHIRRLIINYWNAFIYQFESLDTPDGYRSFQITNISQLLSVLIIIVVNVFLDYRETMKARQKLHRRTKLYREKHGKWKTFKIILSHEIEQRNLSWQISYKAIHNSLQPTNFIKTCTWFLWYVNVNKLIMLPYNLYYELVAVRDLVFQGQTKLICTYVGRLSFYIPMLIYAQVELFKICYEIFKAPVNIYEELFERPTREKNILHKRTYCGRKNVSFSKSIDATVLRDRLNFSSEVRESDFILSCLSAAIYDYFEEQKHEFAVPRMLNTTCRTIAKGYFTDSVGDKCDYIGGVVFLQLPLQVPDREHARHIHEIIENIRRKQIMIYLASMGQTKYDLITSLLPQVLTKIFINFFATNFPITITEIHGANSEFQTKWGERVEDVLLFRPPQSKTCLSLNIHRFGDKYRLAVMADAQLGREQHAVITRSFEKYMESASL